MTIHDDKLTEAEREHRNYLDNCIKALQKQLTNLKYERNKINRRISRRRYKPDA